MDAKELRQFSTEELKGRVRQWQDELFRARFKGQSTETKNTSVFLKLRRDIARALTVISEGKNGTTETAPVRTAPAVQDKPVAENKASVKKPASKTKQAKTSAKGSKE